MGAPHDDPQLAACIGLLRRTGAHEVQLRYQDDEEPTVWIAVATWKTDPAGRPAPNGVQTRHDAAGAMDPLAAVQRLCEVVVDGAECANCRRPTGVTFDYEPMPLRENVCWWQYDTDTQKFVRDCAPLT